MPLRRWCHPSWCGDFRLEADGDDACKLVVIDATPAEQELLDKFMKKARKKGWIGEMVGVKPTGQTTLNLPVPVAEAGKLLLARKAPRKGILTAVKSVKGELEIVLGDDEDKLAEATEKEDADEAVTTRRPTLCCPTPVSGPERRASEVLRAFSTPEQWDSWVKNGFLLCTGGLSGHRYRVCNRHSELARRQGKITWDLDDDGIVHAYDWSLPPAEEVLAMKLALEHAEHWIRNRSGVLRMGELKFRNPFVSEADQGLDGTQDAAFVSGVAGALQGLKGALS
jgi:hypothetical protein